MGSISLVNSTNAGTVNLSSPVQTAWIQFATQAAPNRKADAGQLITNVLALGPITFDTYTGGAVTVTWSDGSPVASGSSTGGIRTTGAGGGGHVGDGFGIGAAADTSVRTFVIYWSIFSGSARIFASVSDSNDAESAIATALPGETQDFVTTITYSADAANEQLQVGISLAATTDPNSCVRIQAAKMLDPVVPTPPTPIPPPKPSAEANPYAPPFEAQFDPERAQQFIIEKLLRGLHTATIVQVLNVRPSGLQGGFVDVQPMILETSTGSTVIEQSPIYNVPYVRYQGGVSAVMLDPAVGDRGLCIFAERDITNVKATAQAGPAATQRAYSSADGLYIGGVLNPPPSQYVLFQPNGAGVAIVSPGDISLQAGGIVNLQAGGAVTLSAGTTMRLAAPGGLTIDANVTLNGTMSGTATGGGAYQFAGTIVAPNATINGIGFNTHKHTGVQTGGGTSGGPTN